MAAKGARDLCKLFVTNVAWTTSKAEFKEYFSKFGNIKSVNLLVNKNTGLYRGYGFVQYVSNTVVNTVINQKHILDGNVLKVQESK